MLKSAHLDNGLAGVGNGAANDNLIMTTYYAGLLEFVNLSCGLSIVVMCT